jgi:hypothetical protein
MVGIASALLLFFAHDTSGLGRSFPFVVLILNLCFSGLAMASGRMILFLVFLFIVSAQAPESCSSLSCDDGPIADMRECFLGGAGGSGPQHEKNDGCGIKFNTFCFNNMFVQQPTLTLFKDKRQQASFKDGSINGFRGWFNMFQFSLILISRLIGLVAARLCTLIT